MELTKGRADHALKWSLTGTAVRQAGQPPAHLFSTSLEEAELVVLHQAGYRPARLVLGLGSVRVAMGCETAAGLTSVEPADLTQIADAYRQASDQAHQELVAQAGQGNADQILNLRTTRSRPVEAAFGGLVYCRMIGDAVSRAARRKPSSIRPGFSVSEERPTRKPGRRPTAFDLDVLASVGLQPIGPISAASVIQLRMARYNRDPAGEISALSQSLAQARHAALERMVGAAAALEAAGVIDVEMGVEWVPWSRRYLLSVTLRGVAVKPLTRTAARGRSARPFLATMTAEDLLLLEGAGWRPVGVAVGISVFNRAWTPTGTLASSVWSGGEAQNFTEAIYGAREVALDRLAEAARADGADGVIGITIDRQSIWGRRAIEMSAIGTSVSAVSGHKRMPEVDLMLSLGE